MCGFIGFISTEQQSENLIEQSNKCVVCRGPDKKTSLSFKYNNKFHHYIFNRLAVLDLSDKANQPMVDKENNFFLMFNGEIFNHMDLRNYLSSKGVKFLTDHSDTEVVFNGLIYEGPKFIEKLRGQFSIFFFSKASNSAYLIRDRLGQKPLFYCYDNKNLIFGSNLTSVINMSKNNLKINIKSLYEYLSYGAITSPNTLFENFYKVSPANYLKFELGKEFIKTDDTIYWKKEKYINNLKFEVKDFYNIFEEAVNIRSTADVPISTFLSGGLDSSSIVKAMYKNKLNINSFNVVFDNKHLDESNWAELVSEKFNTNHKKIFSSNYLSYNEVLKIISKLDEPIADPSFIPTFLVSSEMSKSYKVGISGDGGDELLGGYHRTNHTLKNHNIFLNLISNLYQIYPSFLGTGNNLKKYSSSSNKVYNSFLKDEKFLSLLGVTNDNEFRDIKLNENITLFKSLILAEYDFYLPEIMMVKIDRASMSNSLEARSPFLDHYLIEYVLSHDLKFEVDNSKYLLKNYLQSDFSYEFINRSKQGFQYDVKKFIYSNKKTIIHNLNNSPLNDYIKLTNLSKIYKFETRINANRIWKILVLDTYLKSTNYFKSIK